MRITIIGSGYVGLVSGACFSEFGVDVTCVDNDADKVARLQRGEIPIYEPGLEMLVERNSAAGRLHFTTSLAEAVRHSALVFIAVGTPERRGDGAADLQYVYEAARQVAPHIKNFTTVVTKSTVPVGTGAQVAALIRETNPEADFAMASNPEFLREGSAIEDFMRPDRVVIGVEDSRAEVALRSLYRPLFLIETPILVTNIVTAELTKYAANAFLATKIMYINQIANLCERVGADVHAVAKGMGLDRRIGGKFLHPGPGYGGSCFPKDTIALTRTAAQHGEPMTIVEGVIAANEQQKVRMAHKIMAAMGEQLRGSTLAVLGLAFKPNTDDMREAPALTILPMLQQGGARLRVFDPEAMAAARRYLPDLHYCTSAYEACEGVDGVILLTEWNQFRNLDLPRIKAGMRGGYLFCDLRNVYVPESMRQAGFHYVGVGRV
ncbi:MAG: UDP-glucose/GDP-mannose dehydrogenase family protein [Magnetococcales bacterium]|nr:UDP-glucose/GDP-mannose dehydrogenase family protein [Magnetococcales bacterium]MBF0114457.1 UDP-glucose/GDP-mannose dehydrogenase family protein [Magnetococcales bacterium]